MTNSGFWTQGEIQAGRALPRPSSRATGWEQTTLLPPTVLEADIRVGWIPGDDHIRWQIEMIDPESKELLAMRSVPARRLHEVGLVPQELMLMLQLMAAALIGEDCDPFP